MDTPTSTAPATAPVATGAAPASSSSTAPTARAASQPHSVNAAPASVTDTAAPSTGTPEPNSADPASPETANPETANPDAANPETANPDAANPETANPDAASGIAITLPDSIPQEMIDHSMIDSYTSMAKATGLSPEQAQQAANWYVEHMQKAQEQNRAAGEAHLRQLWGRNFSGNMETSRVGLATLDKFMGGDITSQIVNTGLSELPVVARIFHFFGDALNEHGMSSGTPGVSEERVMDPEEFVKNVINQSTPRQ